MRYTGTMPSRRKVTPISNPTLSLFAAGEDEAKAQTLDRALAVQGMQIGTSAFTAAGWETAFHPAGMKAADYLGYYATRFNSVEVDSTFYRCPSASVVNRWYAVTPPDFIFSLKVPQAITHEKILVDCEKEMDEFIDCAELLNGKLGVLVLQFPYFGNDVFKGPDEFFSRLRLFLKRYGDSTIRFAVEIRNRQWLSAEFAELLREYRTALVLQDRVYMPLPSAMAFDYFTADFTYIRLLGDRTGIERQTKSWDKIVVNRSRELQSWVGVCQRAVRRGVKVFLYINNHFAGHAPATVADFMRLWKGANT